MLNTAVCIYRTILNRNLIKKIWEMFSFFEIIEILALSFYSDCLKYTNMQNLNNFPFIEGYLRQYLFKALSDKACIYRYHVILFWSFSKVTCEFLASETMEEIVIIYHFST